MFNSNVSSVHNHNVSVPATLVDALVKEMCNHQ